MQRMGGVGRAYDAICKRCGGKFHVSEGSGMIAMPFHCEQCGQVWWWEFGPRRPMGKTAAPPRCDCGGSFTAAAPPRCPLCRSPELEQDPEGTEVMYD